MKTRQVTFREMGGTGYAKAQRVAYNIRSHGGYTDKYKADQGSIPSPAGMWADTPYIMTDAPLAIVRKYASAEGLTIVE